jgi:thiamine kinase-like enzyme
MVNRIGTLKRVLIILNLQSIPGQEGLTEWFESKMSRPDEIHRKAGQNVLFKFKSITHGDLWHNNLFFKPNSREVLITDWQMVGGSKSNVLA